MASDVLGAAMARYRALVAPSFPDVPVWALQAPPQSDPPYVVFMDPTRPGVALSSGSQWGSRSLVVAARHLGLVRVGLVADAIQRAFRSVGDRVIRLEFDGGATTPLILMGDPHKSEDGKDRLGRKIYLAELRFDFEKYRVVP